jgi:hypothetical protein
MFWITPVPRDNFRLPKEPFYFSSLHTDTEGSQRSATIHWICTGQHRLHILRSVKALQLSAATSYPKVVFLIHYGSPHLVKFYELIFKSVAHLYTHVAHMAICIPPMDHHCKFAMPHSSHCKNASWSPTDDRYQFASKQFFQPLEFTTECTEFDNPQYPLREFVLEGCRELNFSDGERGFKSCQHRRLSGNRCLIFPFHFIYFTNKICGYLF